MLPILPHLRLWIVFQVSAFQKIAYIWSCKGRPYIFLERSSIPKFWRPCPPHCRYKVHINVIISSTTTSPMQVPFNTKYMASDLSSIIIDSWNIEVFLTYALSAVSPINKATKSITTSIIYLLHIFIAESPPSSCRSPPSSTKPTASTLPFYSPVTKRRSPSRP